MSDRPVGDPIDRHLREAMTDLADQAPPIPDLDELSTPVIVLEPSVEESPVKSRTLAALVAAVAAVMLIVAVLTFTGNGDDDTIVTNPTPNAEPDDPIPGVPRPTAAELAATAAGLVETDAVLALLLAAEADALSSDVDTQRVLFEALVATDGIVTSSVPLDSASAATVSPNGELVVTSAPARVWDVTGSTAREVTLPDGVGAFLGRAIDDDEIYLEVSSTNAVTYSYPGFTVLDEITRVRTDVLPGGNLVVGGPTTVAVVDRATREVLAEVDNTGCDESVGCWPAVVSVSHDGEIISQRNPIGTVLVHDADTLEPIAGHPLEAGPFAAASTEPGRVGWIGFSPVEPVALISLIDGGSALVDTANGETINALGPDAQGVQWAEFSEDGRRLVTPTPEGVQIWDTATGALVAAVDLDRGGYAGAYGTIELFLDIARPATGARFMTVPIGREAGFEVWNIDPADWPGLACSTAGRALTDAERAEYGLSDVPSTCG